MFGFRKATVKQYKTDPKTGKRVETSRVVVSGKGANAEKAMIASNNTRKPTKMSNQRDLQRQQHTEHMAKIAANSTNIANAITQAGLTAQKAIGGTKAVETNTVNASTVDQLVNGGAQVAGAVRDDAKYDEEDSEWVA